MGIKSRIKEALGVGTARSFADSQSHFHATEQALATAREAPRGASNLTLAKSREIDQAGARGASYDEVEALRQE